MQCQPQLRDHTNDRTTKILCSKMSLLQNMLFDPYGSIFHELDGSGDDSIRMDWKETEAAHVLKADLPGFKKEDVKVEVEDGGVISITAKRPRDEKDEEEEECTWHCSERRSRDGLLRRRRFRLPEDVKAEEAKASMENGVLTLVVPKVEVKKPQVRSVEIEGGDGKKKRSEKGKKNKEEPVCCTFWHR
ncbi:16.9 kDa class I heat shock protein 1-like [Curcuma longa]|uniref:16.9 kDa class I heat shock protein 1-like n=1 Tax=Curcuma longa TaxID=136217 RepID=UPI003D9EBE2B